jgi:hypothetical protein
MLSMHPTEGSMICGLYCGACRKYLNEKCPGCAENTAASWCTVRSCCREQKFASCADCAKFGDIAECSIHNNFIAKAIGFFFNSDRKACIREIKQKGYETFARKMADRKAMTIKK